MASSTDYGFRQGSIIHYEMQGGRLTWEVLTVNAHYVPQKRSYSGVVTVVDRKTKSETAIPMELLASYVKKGIVLVEGRS